MVRSFWIPEAHPAHDQEGNIAILALFWCCKERFVQVSPLRNPWLALSEVVFGE